MRVSIFTLLEAILSAWTATALPVNHTDDQVGAVIVAGSFENPSVNVRPRYRYWIPDASINTTLFADDIAQLAARGAGGIEFLNYFDYGGSVGNGPSTDWNIYGYGTPAYLNLLKVALQTHQDLGLIMDFSMGPQSGQGVPAEPDEPGLEYNLDYYNVSLSAGETFVGILPGWGSGEFVAAQVFATTNATKVSSVVSNYALIATIEDPFNSTLHTIASSSLTDITAQVQQDGSVNVDAPTIDGAIDYYLMAGYYSRSYDRACIASSPDPQNILQNGSFAVDHFSTVGAKLTTDFLEQYILIEGIDDLMRAVGNYIWEDSVEVPGVVYWTPNLTTAFQAQHGYGIQKYLPLLAGRNGQINQGGSVGPDFFILDTEDEGTGVVGDWRLTMTNLLGGYYDHLVNWSNSYLNLQFSGQIGYNLPTDMLANVARVNAPETESLSFMNNIDSFRQYAGPANLAGKRVISMETGSDFFETYTQTWTDLLRDAKRAFVTGVNQVVLHGAPYSHTYPNTTWPGFTSFGYSFAAHHSRHQPAWDVGYAEAGEYLARTQYVLQCGVPKVDLVLWDKRTAEVAYPETLYWPGDLTAAGYSYSYLSPEDFTHDNAFVSNGVLAPDSQAFRALIVRANDTLTVNGVLTLAGYARAGLHIIISGGIPGDSAIFRQPVLPHYTAGQIPAAWDTNNMTGIQEAQAALQSILSLPNVYQVPYESLAESVQAAGIHPRTKVTAADPGVWITLWREDQNGDEYVFIYNEGGHSTGSVSFETTQTPSFLNAWTGEEIPIVCYVSDDTHTTIDFSLGATQTVIVKFSKSSSLARTHVVSAPSDSIVNVYSGSDARVAARMIATGVTTTEDVILSDGRHLASPSSLSPTMELTDWTLVVEEWNPPDDLFDVEIIANKTNVTFALDGPGLQPWHAISESLTNISGIGYYSTTFTWPADDSRDADLVADGAFLTLPPITHGVTASLNGKALPPLDLTQPIADIGSYLIDGENQLSINVASTLFNVLRPIWTELRTGTSTPNPPTAEGFAEYGFGGVQDYGLIGEVQVVPYMALAL